MSQQEQDPMLNDNTEDDDSFDEEAENPKSNCGLYVIGACLVGALLCMAVYCFQPETDNSSTGDDGTGESETAVNPGSAVSEPVQRANFKQRMLNATIRNPFAMAGLMMASMVGLLFCMKNNKKVAASCCCCLPRERPSPGFNPRSKMQMGGLVMVVLSTIGCGTATYLRKDEDEKNPATQPTANTNLCFTISGIFLSLCGGLLALAGLQGMLPSNMNKRKGPIMSIGFMTLLGGMAFCAMSRPQNRAAVKEGLGASKARSGAALQKSKGSSSSGSSAGSSSGSSAGSSPRSNSGSSKAAA